LVLRKLVIAPYTGPVLEVYPDKPPSAAPVGVPSNPEASEFSTEVKELFVVLTVLLL
jgi:hypothetical protein